MGCALIDHREDMFDVRTVPKSACLVMPGFSVNTIAGPVHAGILKIFEEQYPVAR